MARLPPRRSNLESPEEEGAGRKPPRGGETAREEGGFADGEYGRGSTPYKKSHSAPMGTLENHSGTSGRGGSGIFGKSDQFKGHAKDLEHPCTHAEFERMGHDDGVGGDD